MRQHSFYVRGTPVAKGSMSVVTAGDGRAYAVDQKRKSLKEWERAIADAARDALTLLPPMRGPVLVAASFEMPRPKSHYGTGGNAGVLKSGAPIWHTKTPDADKLVRALLDGLTAAAMFADDAQVAGIDAQKRYGDTPGVRVVVTEVVS